MKKLRLLALAMLLAALGANGMVTSVPRTHQLCAGLGQPNDLCSGTVDTGCNDWCATAPGCADFTDVHGSCGVGGTCECRGTPLP